MDPPSSPAMFKKQLASTNLRESFSFPSKRENSSEADDFNSPVPKRRRTLPQNDSGFFSPTPSSTSLWDSEQSPSTVFESPNEVQSSITSQHTSETSDQSNVLSRLLQASIDLTERDSPHSEEPKLPRKRRNGQHQLPLDYRPEIPEQSRLGAGNSGRRNSERKRSACIICERTRKPSLKTYTSVIIKTNLPRRQLLRRGFSDAVQVIRESPDSPYVEVQLPTRHELCGHDIIVERKRKASMQIKENTLQECICENLAQKFILWTHWDSLIPELFSKKILSTADVEKLRSYSTQQERGIYFYIILLPSKGFGVYSDFYECLEREPKHRGHSDLVELLEEALLKQNIF